MSTFSASICLSRSLTRSTSAPMRLSVSLIWLDRDEVIRLLSPRKSSTLVMALLRSRVDDGSSAAMEKAA
jgi:hypothetical protein